MERKIRQSDGNKREEKGRLKTVVGKTWSEEGWFHFYDAKRGDD